MIRPAGTSPLAEGAISKRSSRSWDFIEFADIVVAHRLIESGDARGKIVVRGPED